MNKGVMIGIVVAVIVVIGAGAYFLIGGEKECETLKKDSNYVTKFVDLAVEKNDSATCSEVCYLDGRDICYQIVAGRLQNVNICDEIVSDLHQGQCIFASFYSSSDPAAELCQKIRNVETEGFCLRLLANKKGSEEICDLIKDTTEKSYCYNNVKDGPVEIRGDGTAEEITFDCANLFPQCDPDWLKENINGISDEVTDYCTEECNKISRRSGGKSYNTASAEISCRCQ